MSNPAFTLDDDDEPMPPAQTDLPQTTPSLEPVQPDPDKQEPSAPTLEAAALPVIDPGEASSSTRQLALPRQKSLHTMVSSTLSDAVAQISANSAEIAETEAKLQVRSWPS